MNRFSKVSLGVLLITLLIGVVFIAGCTTTQPSQNATIPATTAVSEKPKLLIATTTSLYDTGLLNYLEQKYEAQNNVDLQITSQGSGKAIEIAKKGDVDVLLVHSPAQELAFMKDGYGINRRSFASNYYLVVGPSNDPAGIRNMTPETAFTALLLKGSNKTAGVNFVSRGDGSGTHSAEKAIWSKANFNYTMTVEKSGNWYIEAGKGMGETLQMASEKKAYALTDEGTFLAYKSNLTIVPIITEGTSLLNIYSVMTVYNDKQPVSKIQMANNFTNFLISAQTQTDLSNFGVAKYGKALFTPMSVRVPTATAGWVGDYSTPATDLKPPAAVSNTTATK
ncbi:MAG: substrate-binding domain-containing protein [Methanoregula sp.]|nr:substrate-binding domain-containing protein [Methanoregula sp.]